MKIIKEDRKPLKESMKKQNITIDINQLDEDTLKTLQEITYNLKDMRTSQQIYMLRAFIKGWMDEEMAEEYRKKYLLD